MKSLSGVLVVCTAIAAVASPAAAQSDIACPGTDFNEGFCPGHNTAVHSLQFEHLLVSLAYANVIVLGRWSTSAETDPSLRGRLGACVDGFPTRLLDIDTQLPDTDPLLQSLDSASSICTGGGNDNVRILQAGEFECEAGGDILQPFAYNGHMLFLYTQAGMDTVAGGGGEDVICGGSEVDTIRGGSGDDQIYGMTGGDKLNGQWGYDYVNGGPDGDRIFETNDTLADDLMGGSGASDCVYDLATGGNPADVNCACYNGAACGGGTSPNTGAGVLHCTYLSSDLCSF